MTSIETDAELIATYIEPDPWTPDPAEVRVKPRAVPVYALIGDWPLFDPDVEALAEAFDIPVEAVRAALAYYARHRYLIDARLVSNSAGSYEHT